MRDYFNDDFHLPHPDKHNISARKKKIAMSVKALRLHASADTNTFTVI